MEAKTELEQLKEMRDGAINDLMFMNHYQGDSPVIDANIRHKKAQIRELEEKIRRMEGDPSAAPQDDRNGEDGESLARGLTSEE